MKGIGKGRGLDRGGALRSQGGLGVSWPTTSAATPATARRAPSAPAPRCSARRQDARCVSVDAGCGIRTATAHPQRALATALSPANATQTNPITTERLLPTARTHGEI
eukprot:2248084-Rhodomonas_salina.1